MESIVRNASLLYAVYCSSLTGLPPKLSRVVPTDVSDDCFTSSRVYNLTSKYNNSSRCWASYSVRDFLHIQDVMSQCDVAAILANL